MARNVGTRVDNTTRRRESRGKRVRRRAGKTARRAKSVTRSEREVAKRVIPAAEKSRYGAIRARTENRHRWMRRES